MLRVVCLTAVMLHTGCAHHSHDMEMHHRFERAEDWVARFEDPARDAWQKPDEVLSKLQLPPNATVADLGAATGYFSVRLAKALPQGRVFGVDIESSMVDYLTQRAKTEGLTNLTAVLGAEDDAKLPEAVDLIVVVDTYHHIGERSAYFKRLTSSLKAGGRLVIIDFTMSSSMGPPRDAKVSPETVRAELEAAGYTLQASHDFLPEQFMLVFQPTAMYQPR